RAHRARIDVEIGIELPDPDAIATRLEESCERGRHEAFTERRDHAAGDEDIPRHGKNRLALCERDCRIVGRCRGRGHAVDRRRRIDRLSGHRILRRRGRRPAGERGVDRLGAVSRRQHCERDREQHEQGGEHPGGPGEEIRRAARRHQPRRAAAHAKPAAFRPLHQDHRHERRGDDGMYDEKEGEH
nr:hypothetical protein [Tanacetum cinerariifolium]